MRRFMWIGLLLLAFPALTGWIRWTSSAKTKAKEEARPPVAGIWVHKSNGCRGAFERTWFFDDKGHGLSRVLHDGVANTLRFAYEVDGETLVIRLDKNGREFRSAFTVEKGKLTLAADPQDELSRTYSSYSPSTRAPHLYGSFAAWDGDDFRMYQILAPNSKGRGKGWLHVGTADEWRSEPFAYRTNRRFLEATFAHRKGSDREAVVTLRHVTRHTLFRAHASESEEIPCVYSHASETFSRWLVGIPRPYRTRPQLFSPAKMDAQCQAQLVMPAKLAQRGARH